MGDTEEALLARLKGHIEFVSHREEDERVAAYLNEELSELPNGITVESLQEDLKALQKKKDDLLLRMDEAMKQLNATPVGMDQPLINPDGFPRSDCDLVVVRTARNTVICGRNDLVTIQNEMFEKLNLLHTATKADGLEQMARDEPAMTLHREAAAERRRQEAEMKRVDALPPMVVVGDVALGSPAHEGGLRGGHLVVEFGDLNALNLASRGGLRAMAEPVKEAAARNAALSVWVRSRGGRGSTAERGDLSQLMVVPRDWASGKGLLGCGFDPYVPPSQ